MPVTGGTQSDTLIKDVAQTIQSELFPALTDLLERYGRFGQQQSTGAPGGVQRSDDQWAEPEFQVKQSCDRITEMIRRGNVQVDQIDELQLSQEIRQQPGAEKYLG